MSRVLFSDASLFFLATVFFVLKKSLSLVSVVVRSSEIDRERESLLTLDVWIRLLAFFALVRSPAVAAACRVPVRSLSSERERARERLSTARAVDEASRVRDFSDPLDCYQLLSKKFSHFFDS